MMHDLRDIQIGDLENGMRAQFEITITPEDVATFAGFSRDAAPVHNNVEIAAAMGYERPIVYGLMVFGRFSGLLGMVMPGPRTVIHSASFAMKKPVYVGDRLTYVAEVRKVVRSVKSVILDLKVFRNTDELILKGEAQCGFRR